MPEHAERGVGGRWSVVTGGGRGDWSPEAKARVGTSRDSRGRKGLAHAEGPGGGLDFTERVMGEMSWNLLLSVCPKNLRAGTWTVGLGVWPPE